MLGEYRISGGRAAEISASVERGVGEGALAPGQLLPPMRELAAELGVNPNTVASAYRMLRERGVIETAGRRGSRIRARPAVTARESIRADLPEGVRDLSMGNPDPALLPSLRDALGWAVERADARPVMYGEETVEPELARLAREGFDAAGVPDGPVAVASGSLDAIERVLAVHLKPGDTVAVEDPGWGAMLDLVPALGLRAVPVAVDDEGPLPGEVERALRGGARAVVVTSRAQNPTGAAVSARRAAELREVLAGWPTVLLVEDDHGHGIVDLPVNALSGGPAGARAGGGPWVFVRSVSKGYGPDLRVAVLTGDAETVDRVRGRQRLGPGWVSRLLQQAVVRLWTSGAVDTDAVARSYGERRDALVAGLAERGVRAYGRSGMNVWVPVADETGVVARMLYAGWGVAPGARFRMAAGAGVRLTVSSLGVEEIGVVADAVADAVGPGPREEGRRYG
ncbi:aminotransferase class I/II-fold pyridoxal phosphate-dependent enzyme [Streptomyces sp. NBC_00237]|uniref:aminotransferase class I/II-fold pyridoxal phosphate-dependent enzyme n=1 Tax=Streptomyces sp. NBC_00237 TaxID=2975687 RepID=UPI002257C5A5|nr:aminotransferase class I/II-fold pyridoxal phosphate-dependent enzyme [Streptomyces sp. NBC_00237]MCX5206790.1 aminotransferase class I/II-fold pyridoxal phosphate-dependent enzyme [Streptomyces sp. NBC_00237]